MSFLLASGSPGRAELLSQLAVQFRQVSVDIDETPFDGEAPIDYVRRMSHQKIRKAVELHGKSHEVILTADTSVAPGQKILGKPGNFSEFTEMMQALSNRQHRVYTSVSVVCGDREESALSTSLVWFAELTENDILWYWQTTEPRDKAGGYGIQGQGARFIKSISGSYSGILGLPLYETAEILVNFGILNNIDAG